MKKYDYIIAIDPDCEKSGVSQLRIADRHIECDCKTFPELLDHLKFIKTVVIHESSVLIVVEASWLNGHHNWHGKASDGRYISSSKGYDIGRNHETGRKIIEMCKHYGLDVAEQRPLKKCWSGPDRKKTQGEIEQFIPGFPKRSNQEIRDSALLAWNYAGFPIRLKLTKTIKKPKQ